MKLRGVEFGKVFAASGMQGFFGEGYWYHRFLKPFGLNFEGITFVAKTTTLNPRAGNMLLDSATFRPQELFPKCVIVKPFKGVTLNAVGLSGPGAKALFETNLWQARTKPFFLSFMAVADTPKKRREELNQFIRLFQRYLPALEAPVGLQLNFSCPNVELHPEELSKEVKDSLYAACCLGIPLMPKFNALLSLELAIEISRNQLCDAICISNTIPWGQLPEQINWERLFGSKISPLAHLGGGGLSGKPLLNIVIDWTQRARKAGIAKPINAGGGILSLRDAQELLFAGASSISLGSIAMLRPWRVRKIIEGIQRFPVRY